MSSSTNSGLILTVPDTATSSAAPPCCSTVPAMLRVLRVLRVLRPEPFETRFPNVRVLIVVADL